MRPAFPPRAVINFMLAAFSLRWFGLERHSLWFDEGVTWAWATKPTLGETVFAEANHPPVWWIVTRIWVTLFGDAEESLRAPAALCGVAAVFLAWRLGLRLFSPAHAPRRGGFLRGDDDGSGGRQALWFAVFLALSTYFIEVSQEARMYALLLAESLGLALLYLRWLDRDDRASLVGFAGLAALALYTHYFAVWPLAALGVHALFLAWRTRGVTDPAQRVRLLPFAAANGAAALLFVPWFVHMLRNYEGLALAPGSVPHWQLLYVLRRMAAGPTIVMEPPWTTVADLAWMPALLLGVWGLTRRRGTGSLVLCALAVPLVGLLALFPRWNFLHERYLLFLAPWLWLLAVAGAYAVRGVLRAGVLAALLVLVGLGLVGYHLGANDPAPRGTGTVSFLDEVTEIVPDPQDPTWFLHHGYPYAKEPWRYAQEFVQRYGGDDDLVVIYPDYLRMVWDYYDRKRRGGPLTVLALHGVESPAAALQSAHESLFDSHRRIFVVVSHAKPDEEARVHAALFRAIDDSWQADGSPPTKPARPIPFRVSWGLSISVITRQK
jgi:4-amino-4-deoxy-L-arabinose transferase-like glycosyltransferase